MTVSTRLFPDTYVDSVTQLVGMRAMLDVDGVDWASAAMATPANVDSLHGEGVAPDQTAGAAANDFLLVVRAADEETAAAALAAGESAVFAARPAAATTRESEPGSVRDAVRRQPGSNVAVVSVPGRLRRPGGPPGARPGPARAPVQ